MRPTAERRGFTAVEVLIWLLLVMMVAALAATATRWARISWTSGVERLDQFGALRMASLRLTGELAYARELLHPPPGQDGPFHQLVFVGQHNELMILFVDEEGKLMLVSRSDEDRPQVLTRRTIDLDVRRPGPAFVEFLVTVADERGRAVSLGNGLRLRNAR